MKYDGWTFQIVTDNVYTMNWNEEEERYYIYNQHGKIFDVETEERFEEIVSMNGYRNLYKPDPIISSLLEAIK